MRFGRKDVFDVAGRVTGCGNPDRRRTHAPASAHAVVLTRLLAAGAELSSQTVTDELAYSLNGENWHDGTPPNQPAQRRIPGSSLAGSASAVAAGTVDFAIGTDCGGSLRIRASFCGLYGMRRTHGSIATEGLIALAPTFDAVGWFAGNADTLRRVGAVLVEAAPAGLPKPTTLMTADDLFARLGAAESAALTAALARLKVAAAQVSVIDG